MAARCRAARTTARRSRSVAPRGDTRNNGQGAIPATGATIELVGRAIGSSDPAGRFAICAEHARDVQVRLVDHDRAPDSVILTGGVAHPLTPATTIVGTVLAADGKLAAAVGVQPMWLRPGTDGECEDSDLIVTTDAAGHFAYAGYDALCGFRVFRNTEVQHRAPALGDGDRSVEIVPAGDGRALGHTTLAWSDGLEPVTLELKR